MRLFLLGFILLFCFVFEAQNLVPNSSFENLTTCSSSVMENASPWCSVNPAGVLNTCISHPVFSVPSQTFSPGYPSYQMPYSGNGYATFGFIYPTITASARYPQVKLTDTLKSGKIYCVTYYVSLWNDCKYSADKMGALLTATPFNCTVTSQNLYTGYTPQVVSPSGYLYNDTLNWQEVSGTFTAVGNEAYLTIGNFFPNTAHTYSISYPGGVRQLAEYYLDDVSLEEVQIAKAKNDTLIMQGDSATIGLNNSEAALFSWQPIAGLSCTNCPNPKASPSVTTTYTVTKTQCKSVTSDVITVTVSPVGVSEAEALEAGVKLVPNPVNDILNINFKSNEMLKQVQHDCTIKITDVLGKEVLQTGFKEQLNISHLETGIYFVSILQGNKSLITKKVVKE
jgi:hypothetical protein